MTSRTTPTPPRPIAAGDIVAAFSDALGAWTAAQITSLDPASKTATVLELDWSGPEPASTAGLGDVAPLRLTHHSWDGQLSHCNYEWLLPRGCKVIGSLPLLGAERANAYSSGWPLGEQLARQRRWDGGDRGDWSDPHAMSGTGAEISQALSEPAEPRRHIRSLSVTRITSLDCARLVEHFPDLTRLRLHGDMGLLSNASHLNELTSLKSILISDLFGMDVSDRLLPLRVPALESLHLHSVPAVYATAMRSTWRPQIRHGTQVRITAARRPEWIAENQANPLRDWDGREHIGKACYKKALTMYKSIRREVMTALAESDTDDRASRLFEIGRRYGEGFNALDARTPFIETVEREELFAALDFIMTEAEHTLGRDLPWARESLLSGVDSVRDW
ncbi:hypothetical protein GCM10023196_025240 [Actinoallomurus vinaceus]|uniref:Uncharacterized protein n=1 Tax=Actinoallomurus vinaceus TaxID=1080074 RepID=A0ABP8U7V7_9ACTN